MNRDEIEKLIEAKIKEHESRVGLISGFIGLTLLFGLFHAVWMLKITMP